MRKITSLLTVLLALCIVFTSGCTEKQEEDNKPVVAVSILPQAEFVEKIAGDHVNVLVMVPLGADPHTYEISSGQLRELDKAQMYVKVGSGMDFENVWMDKLIAQNPKMRIVDSSEGISLRTMGAHSHDVGPTKTNEHTGAKDPHIWTSPVNAKIMVNNIYAGLVQADPDNKDTYTKNRDTYLAELDAVDASIRKSLSGKEGSSFIVYHPAWGYFADEYGLIEISVEIEGKEPSAKDMQNLIDIAKEKQIKVIFIQPGLSTTSAKAIASEVGAEVIAISPLAKDYLDNLQNVSEAFKKGMSEA